MKKGFTLIELMVVVVIIGILAALAIPKFLGATDKAKLSEWKNITKEIVTLQNAYGQYHDTFYGSSATTSLAVSSKQTTNTWGAANASAQQALGFDAPGGDSRFNYATIVSDADMSTAETQLGAAEAALSFGAVVAAETGYMNEDGSVTGTTGLSVR